MYHHVKKLMYTVTIGEADPRFGKMLLEQFGGANGELAAAMLFMLASSKRCRAGRPRRRTETPCHGRRTPAPGSRENIL